MRRSALCRSRRELSNALHVIATVSCPNFHLSISPHVPFLNLLFEQIAYSNEYLLAKFGFDTAENEPSKVCPLSAYISPRSFCPQTRDRQVVSAHTRETSGLRAAFSSRCTPASACSAGPAAWSLVERFDIEPFSDFSAK